MIAGTELESIGRPASKGFASVTCDSRRWLAPSQRRFLAFYVGLLSITALILRFAPLPDLLSPHYAPTTRFYDERGALMRETREDDLRSEWTNLQDIPLIIRATTIAAEDKHLRWHPGVDPVGIVRALLQDLRAGRVVSGASTLSMQLARIAYNLPRTPLGKLEQALLGVVIQIQLGPDRVLETYLNVAPYGRDIRGVTAAARVYFGKTPQQLTAAEAASLAALPRGPRLYDPYKHAATLLRRRDFIIERAVQEGELAVALADEARSVRVLHLQPFERPFRAPHAIEVARQELSDSRLVAASVVTTIDPSLQSAANRACASVVVQNKVRDVTNCAAVVIRVSTGEVLALVGTHDFRAAEGGQVNHATALRQPGSTLKPFVYGLAFEEGRSAGSYIEDIRTEIPMMGGVWVPSNYDRQLHGRVRLRHALANSYNLPAVALAEELGHENVLQVLRAAGLDELTADAGFYGAGLALGQGEVSLLHLTNAYAGLARGGVFRELSIVRSAVDSDGRTLQLQTRGETRFMSEEASYIVGDVLRDARARRSAFGASNALELPFDAAVKTGTSSNYRDNWTVGYANDIAAGVWVGRSDGAEMDGVSGVTGAAPAWRNIMLVAAGSTPRPWPVPPRGVVMKSNDGVEDYAVNLNVSYSRRVATTRAHHNVLAMQ